MKNSMRNKIALLMVLLLVISAFATACTTEPAASDNSQKADESAADKSDNVGKTDEAGSQQPAGDNIIKFSISAEPPTMDPQIKTASNMAAVATHVFEGLVRIFDGEIRPGMADTWEISSDGLTYTFHIRDDAKWDDGTKVTAHDFEYGFLRIVDPAVGSEFGYLAYDIVNAEEYNTGKITDPSQVGVKALDDSNFEIKLKNPVSYFLSYMDFTLFSPTREDLVDKYGSGYGLDAGKLGCNGPYVLKEWNHENNLILEKNPNYWDAVSITTDKIEVDIILDSNTGIALFETGELNIVDIPKDRIDEYKQSGKANFYSDGSVYYLEANINGLSPETGKVLSNSNFRRALGFAIDREQLINAVLKDGSLPATRYNGPSIHIMDNEKGEQVSFYDKYPYEFYDKNAEIDIANEYLNKALAELNMAKEDLPTFQYLARDGEDARLLAEAIQGMLKQNLGIDIEIRQVQYKQFLELTRYPYEFDLCVEGWGPDYDDPMTFMGLWVIKPSGNGCNWANQQYTDMIDFATSTSDMKARADKLLEAEKYLMEEGPVIPLYFRYKAYAMSDNISNIDRPFVGGQPKCMYAVFE